MKKIGLFFLLLLCVFQKVACSKSYQVETESGHIDVELTALSREEMEHHIGFSQCLFSWMLSEDKGLLEFLEKYTLVKVRIKNRSSVPIFLKKDEYLLGIDDVFVPREELLSWYKVLRPLQRKRALARSFFTLFAGGIAAASMVAGVVTEEKPFFLLSALTGLIFSGIGLSTLGSINKHFALKRQEAFFRTATNKVPTDDFLYKVNANETFEDLFFVCTSALKEDFFNGILPELEAF